MKRIKEWWRKHDLVGFLLTILLIVAVTCLLLFLVVGWVESNGMEQMPNEGAATRFSVVDSYGRFDVIVDLDTGVMYSISENGAMTPLVNWDGSPRCYPGFDAREDRP